MAQSVARQAVNLQVAGSNPAGGDFGESGLLGVGVCVPQPPLLPVTGWPSGLRRQTQVLVSSEARVRTPLLSKEFGQWGKHSRLDSNQGCQIQGLEC